MSETLKGTIWLLSDPEIVDRMVKKIISNRFSDYIGLRYTSIGLGVVEAMLPMQDNLRQQNDFLHGGVTATLCDIVAGFAAYTLLPITEPGKKLHFCESEVYTLNDGVRKVIAKATASMIVIR